MKNIILTLDYELYGNGSGNVFRHIIEPTEKILSIAERYNVKITIFFEVIEYGAQNEAYMSRSAEKWVRGLCFNELGVCS